MTGLLFLCLLLGEQSMFHWPIYWVYAMTYVVNLIQATIGHFRIRSGKWIRNLVHD